jgi:hypothetical protein
MLTGLFHTREKVLIPGDGISVKIEWKSWMRSGLMPEIPYTGKYHRHVEAVCGCDDLIITD